MKINKTISITAAILIIISVCAVLVNYLTSNTIRGFSTPESVIETGNGEIYVSEINSWDKGDGQISKVDANGNISVFAKGMDNPKGLTSIGDKLYVADDKNILVITTDGNWEIHVAEKSFPNKVHMLNDLDADADGNLYVSDSGNGETGGAIYKISKDGVVSTIVDSSNPNVKKPNGVLYESQNSLLSVDSISGILYRIDLDSGTMSKIAEGLGDADGIIKTNVYEIYVSDLANGYIYQVADDTLIKKGSFKAPADIALSQNGQYILIPSLSKGRVDFLELK